MNFPRQIGVAVLLFALYPGCVSTYTRQQTVVSKLPYARPPARVGRAGKSRSWVVGGSAEVAPTASAPRTARDGEQKVPTGEVAGWLATVVAGGNIELAWRV